MNKDSGHSNSVEDILSNTHVYEEIPVNILILDERAQIIYLNRAARNIRGLKEGLQIESAFKGFENNWKEQAAATGIHLSDESASQHFLCRLSVIEGGFDLITLQDEHAEFIQLHEIETKKNAAENLLKSAVLETGSLDQALLEICRISAEAMNTSRVNIWEFGSGQYSITCLANYDAGATEHAAGVTLYRYQLPHYFSLLESQEIIPTHDAWNHSNTEELKNGYLDVYGIKSLMDVPVQIAGKMIGVVCFEDTKKLRDWNPGEQKFGLFISQVIALSIESSRRKRAQEGLELLLDEKRILLNEIHRRVRNNFSLIQDLMKTESGRAKDEFHQSLFRDLKNRISSLDMVQRRLYQSSKVDKINFRDMVLDLVAGYRATFSGRSADLITTLDQCELSVSKASIAGLFVNEIMMFLLSQAEKNPKKEKISIRLRIINARIQISIHSSETINPAEEKQGMLTSSELAEKLGTQLETDRTNGTGYEVTFVP